MAWSWSHTEQAYENARLNTHDLPQDELAVILAEWDAYVVDEYRDEFDPDAYTAAYERRRLQPHDTLAENVWDKACDLQTCDNGGFNAWLCPFGCHTVSFDREGMDELEPALVNMTAVLTREQIMACPNVIIHPDHYTADGCRCTDPAASSMRAWGYRWREKEGRWA